MRSIFWFLASLALGSPIESEPQTLAPCEVQSFQVATGTQPFCACSTTSGIDTVKSTITTPPGGNCADYTAFPSGGFMPMPTITSYNDMCQYNFGKESKDGYCACQTTVDGSATSQWVPLPYTMGSYTVLDCHSITSVDFTSASPTPTTSATKTFITDYTSTDIGNGRVWVFPTAYATVGTKNWAGDPDFTGVPETLFPRPSESALLLLKVIPIIVPLLGTQHTTMLKRLGMEMEM